MFTTLTVLHLYMINLRNSTIDYSNISEDGVPAETVDILRSKYSLLIWSNRRLKFIEILLSVLF